jgi:cephalosporin-C deacetylase-like acetyl esterase
MVTAYVLSRCASVLLTLAFSAAAAKAEENLETSLRKLSSRVLNENESQRNLMAADVSQRLRQANERSTAAWHKTNSRADWERHRDAALEALRGSLGVFPLSPVNLQVKSCGEIDEHGYSIRKLAYSSHPDVRVTANLYVPKPARERMPGLLICHSHHAPKTQGELQEMGAMWARAGCLVLVIDQLGHGERRQHPFVTTADYPQSFQPGRQDYYFRYNAAIQLYFAGESLMGWMARDLIRGVDVLLAQPGIDRERIIMLGAVAGGGDPAAVAAALDSRIAAVVPFNFGGPQPESPYPLPEDAETRFNYAGGGSWESTRNLARSASDGFLPWVIVGSVAPRRLIHAHEFAWDAKRDPVWKRYQWLYEWYASPKHLRFTHGFGELRQSGDVASHCTNIGRPHRARIHEAFAEWFGIKVDENQTVVRRPAAELHCLTNADEELPALHTLAAREAQKRSREFAAALAQKPAEQRREVLADAWRQRLGNVEPYAIETALKRGEQSLNNVRVEHWLLQGERGIPLPAILLVPDGRERRPLLVAVAQEGKSGFLQHRAGLLAELAEQMVICLVDVRGTGETAAGDERGRRSAATSVAASELMLGETVLGSQLRDLRSVLTWLRKRPEVDASRTVVYGDSFAPVNAADAILKVPLDLPQPRLAEPAGAALALLAGLFEPELAGVVARGGLLDYGAVFESPFIHLPFDAMVPGAAACGDLPLVAKTIADRPLWLSKLVDGRNRKASSKEIDARYGEVLRRWPGPTVAGVPSDADLARWLMANSSRTPDPSPVK